MRITDLLIPLLFLAGLGVMAWLLMKGKKDRDQALSQLAASRGWRYLPGKGGGWVNHQHPEERNRLFTMEGVTSGGISWRMESRGRLELKGQKTLLAQTRMRLEQSSEVTVMMPDPGTQLSAGMISRLLESYGLDLEANKLQLIPWPKGMQPKYCLYGTGATNLSSLLDTLSMPLSAWVGKLPVASQPVLVSGDETGLYFNWGVEKPEDVTALVTLAEKWSEGLQKLTSAE